MSNLGKCQLPKLLVKRGITQQQLADRTGIRTQQLSRYANNKQRMSMSTAKIISDALGCNVEELYEFDGNE